jgi:hypothetical protein
MTDVKPRVLFGYCNGVEFKSGAKEYELIEGTPGNDFIKYHKNKRRYNDGVILIEMSAYDTLKAQNDELIAALEFYANRDNWKISRETADWPIYEFVESSSDQGGRIARYVLAKVRGKNG